MMRNVLLPGLIAVTLLTSCGRKPVEPLPEPPAKPAAVSLETSPEATPPPASVPVADAAGQPPAEKIEDSLPTAPPDSSLKFPVNKEYTSAMNLYLMDNRKLPPNFDALVKDRYVKEPARLSAGKQLALDRRRMQVVVIDRSAMASP